MTVGRTLSAGCEKLGLLKSYEGKNAKIEHAGRILDNLDTKSRFSNFSFADVDVFLSFSKIVFFEKVKKSITEIDFFTICHLDTKSRFFKFQCCQFEHFFIFPKNILVHFLKTQKKHQKCKNQTRICKESYIQNLFFINFLLFLSCNILFHSRKHVFVFLIQVPCGGVPCPVDCEMGPWTSWTFECDTSSHWI